MSLIVPVGKETQPLFAFTHRGRQYTWTRLPQGYIDSPAVFTTTVKNALSSLCLPPDSVVLKYADDLQPETKQALQAFLGLINYCRQWIPDCSLYDKCLRTAVRHSDTSTTPLTWTPEMLTAFRALKRALCTAPTLGLHNYSLPFHLYVATQPVTASGVLAQEHGGGMRPCAFLSKSLDSVAQGLPACLCAIASCALMVTDAEKIVLSHPLILHTSHQDDCAGQPDHDCLTAIVNDTSIRPDLSSVPLQTGQALFVDGSCSKPSDGVYLCGYSVCQLPNIVLESFSLPFSSAQAAELYTLTRACVLSADTDVTIYTDSRYAFGVAHDFGRIWQSRGFTAANGKPISHASLVQDLITACHLPRSMAIVKTRAHCSGDMDEEWQINFTHMPKLGPFRYLLVMVDTFSRWVEAFPCSKENARIVVQKLTTEIIPRYGIPDGIDSDKGTPFTFKVTQLLYQELKINWHFHIPYHSQSSGIVERANRTIKDKIRKAMHASGSKNWLHALPLVLADMRMTIQVALDPLSPYELVLGRPFPLPWRRGKQALGTGDLDVHLSEYAAGLLQTLDDFWARWIHAGRVKQAPN
ncbi:hypothetical protein C0J50_9279 [Silurus asotus]|uniref:Uncharacterized protein n=1 Tax=Silurus asotus TaxID=30991 RepID=A0AAD5FCQ1_SILAS|nr:hypothetical protein C0J50_9279 [Silurus asotus]